MEKDIRHNNEPISEHDALVKIKDGARLNEFNTSTRLMTFTAVTYHKDGWKEVNEAHWSRRLARYSVSFDFRALSSVPEKFRTVATSEFVQQCDRQDRDGITEWAELLNAQDEKFIRRCVKERASVIRFVSDENKTAHPELEATAKGNIRKKKKEVLPEFDFDNDFEYGFEEAPTSYFTLPKEERTLEKLEEIIASDNKLPANFIKMLILPNRNQVVYTKAGDAERAQSAAEQVLPFVNKDLCLRIAAAHPEASLQTPQFLSPELVRRLWADITTSNDRVTMTRVFTQLPEKLITMDMVNDMKLTIPVVAHVPSLLAGTQTAEDFFARNPAAVLSMPEEFQNEDNLLRDGISLTPNALNQIKNENLRNDIILALNLNHERIEKI